MRKEEVTYGKAEAKMTQGLAAVCMVVLHLWCRLGDDVYGTPIIWLNSEMPFVYLLGFACEIVPALYVIVSGYAQELLQPSNNMKRIVRLLINYWIILFLFSGISLITQPGFVSWGSFVKNIFLLSSYNGAWWYLHSYIFLMLLSPTFLKIVNKIQYKKGLFFSIIGMITMYFVGRFGLYIILKNNWLLEWITTEIYNLFRILPAYFAGVFICKGGVFEKLDKIDKRFVLISNIVVFLFVIFIRKAIFMEIYAVFVFLSFNLLDKPQIIRKLFLYLGKHSTNIWLIHMFFYLNILPIVFIVKYPVLMVLFMLILCILSSYIIMYVNKYITKKLELKNFNFI